MKTLQPVLASDQLYPSGAVYMARTSLEQVRMLGYTSLQLDSATSMLMGLRNGTATVRHLACAGPEIIELFASAGITVDEDIHLYSTGDEATARANDLAARGLKLFWPYPLPETLYPESAHLVPPTLYRRLNAKKNMSALVPAENLARQQRISHEALACFESQVPVCFKAGGDDPTGWGYAVFPCPDQAAVVAARAWFGERRDSIPEVLLEEWIDVVCCWCVGLAIGETETRCFGGAEQVFASACKQSGSMIDPERPLPPAAQALAVQVGEKARLEGFRGVAGLDIGIDRDGRLVVFDPNFRFASSTAQLLFHPAAADRSGLQASHSLQVTPTGSFADMARRLQAPIAEGWFVPTRFFNGEKHPLSNGKHIVTGFVLGADRAEAESRSKLLQTWF